MRFVMLKRLVALKVIKGNHSFPFAETRVKHGITNKKVKTSGVLPSIPNKPLIEENFIKEFDKNALRLIAENIQIAVEKQAMNLSEVNKLNIIVDRDKFQLIGEAEFISWLKDFFPNVNREKIKITLGKLLFGSAIEIQASACQQTPTATQSHKVMTRVNKVKQTFFKSQEGDFAQNAKAAMTEMEETLRANDMQCKDITEVAVVVPSAKFFPALNAEYTKHFLDNTYPIRYTYLDNNIGDNGVRISIKAERYVERAEQSANPKPKLSS